MKAREFEVDGVKYRITDHSTDGVSARDVEQTIRNLHKTKTYSDAARDIANQSDPAKRVVDVHIDRLEDSGKRKGENFGTGTRDFGDPSGYSINLQSDHFKDGQTFPTTDGGSAQVTLDEALAHEVFHIHDYRQNGYEPEGDTEIGAEQRAIDKTNEMRKELGLPERDRDIYPYRNADDGEEAAEWTRNDSPETSKAKQKAREKADKFADEQAKEDHTTSDPDRDRTKDDINRIPDRYYDDPDPDRDVPETFHDRPEKFPPATDVFGTLSAFMRTVIDWIWSAVFNGSPLVLDLDGDGLDLIDPKHSTVYWDIDADGFAEATGWVGPDDGLLALDLSGNGRIDDNSELFGNATGAENGFVALSAYDSNRDGQITRQDAVWSDLRVWRDKNGNGYSEWTELSRLSDHRITSIDLGYANVSLTVAGNEVRQQSSFESRSGGGGIYDVWFTYDETDAHAVGTFPIAPDALDLPDLRGFGTVPSLAVAMSRPGDDDLSDPDSLIALVADLHGRDLARTFGAADETWSLVQRILHTWAGADDTASDARGAFVDGRDLETLEAFWGMEYRQRGYYPDPFYWAGQDLDAAFFTLQSLMSAALLLQSAGAGLIGRMPRFDGETLLRQGTFDRAALAEMTRIADTSGDKVATWSLVVRMLVDTVGLDAFTGAALGHLEAAIKASDDSLSLAGLVKTLPWDAETGISVSGDNGANTLQGGSGNDTLNGDYGDDLLRGGIGADLIFGGGGDDVIVGQTGPDFSRGGPGNDTYRYALGQGVDTYSEVVTGEGNHDVIALGPGIRPKHVTLHRVPSSDLIIEIAAKGQTGTIVIEDQFNYAAGGGHIETLQFAGGATMSLDGISYRVEGTAGDDYIVGVSRGALFEDTIVGGGGDDALYAYGANQHDYGPNRLEGGAGKDSLFGGRGPDTLMGGADEDRIDADSGDDLIDGGKGADLLSGGWGADTYVWHLGDGNDRFKELGSEVDTLRFGPGVTRDMLDFVRRGNTDLEMRVGSDAVLTVDGQYNYRANLEVLAFADGTTFDLAAAAVVTKGTGRADSLSGIIHGGSFVDDLRGFAGNDELFAYGPNQSDYGPNRLDGGPGKDSLFGGRGPDDLIGGAGRDLIDADQGDDLIDAGKGNDTMRGGSGADTYVYNLGDGRDTIAESGSEVDTLRLGPGIAPEDIAFARRGGATLEIDLPGKAAILVETQFQHRASLERIEFADGRTLDLAATEFVTRGTRGADHISGIRYGGSFADDIRGFGGADTLFAYGPNQSDYGPNRLDGGNGPDSLYGGRGPDELIGGRGADVIQNTTGSDTITGGKGNDSLSGGSDDDLYVYAAGDGRDVINEVGGTDTLHLGPGLTADDLALTRRGNAALEIDLPGKAAITVATQFDNRGGLETILFDDGTALDLTSTAFVTKGSKGADTIYGVKHGGSSVDDIRGQGGADVLYASAPNQYEYGTNRLDGGNGNDSLYGGRGPDDLRGGAGRDYLHGGDGGDDVISGGKGRDTLYGDRGSDTYLWSRGDGPDLIVDWYGDADRILFGEGIAAAELTLVRQGNDLKIRLDSTEITLSGQYSGYTVELAEFQDGSTLDLI